MTTTDIVIEGLVMMAVERAAMAEEEREGSADKAAARAPELEAVVSIESVDDLRTLEDDVVDELD
jgi:hypothetical protein